MERNRKRVNKQKKLSGKLNKTPDEGSIEFTFNAPEAKNVSLAGDFNNWDIHSLPMKKTNGKDWRVVVKLAPGRHEYKFFMDGRWVEDVPGVEKVSNSLGTQNFVIYVK